MKKNSDGNLLEEIIGDPQFIGRWQIKMINKIDVKYPRTNEDLIAIIKGLDLNREDKVLAVAGSGDQPFAMLPYVKEVFAVDTNPNQIKFIQKRKDWLKFKEYNYFLEEHLDQLPTEIFYSSNKGDLPLDQRRRNILKSKISKIKSKLDNLTLFSNQSIQNEKFIKQMHESNISFTKIYASNVFNSWWDSSSYSSSCNELIQLIKLLSKEGLIYFSNGTEISEMKKDFPKELILENSLTKIARKYESRYGWRSEYDNIKPRWNPLVYRKVAD
jgi:hypothetical protein